LQCGALNLPTFAACCKCGAAIDTGVDLGVTISPESAPQTRVADEWPTHREPSLVSLWLAILLAAGSVILGFAFRTNWFELGVSLVIFLAALMAIFQAVKYRGTGKRMPAFEEVGRFAWRILGNLGIVLGLFLAVILSPLILLVLICAGAQW
jgi:hypothetical protein